MNIPLSVGKITMSSFLSMSSYVLRNPKIQNFGEPQENQKQAWTKHRTAKLHHSRFLHSTSSEISHSGDSVWSSIFIVPLRDAVVNPSVRHAVVDPSLWDAVVDPGIRDAIFDPIVLYSFDIGLWNSVDVCIFRRWFRRLLIEHSVLFSNSTATTTAANAVILATSVCWMLWVSGSVLYAAVADALS
ncbi:hypothetical protein ACFX16_002545 [Malus domestica]